MSILTQLQTQNKVSSECTWVKKYIYNHDRQNNTKNVWKSKIKTTILILETLYG